MAESPRMRGYRVILVSQKSEMKINIEKVLISEIAINQDQATFRRAKSKIAANTNAIMANAIRHTAKAIANKRRNIARLLNSS